VDASTHWADVVLEDVQVVEAVICQVGWVTETRRVQTRAMQNKCGWTPSKRKQIAKPDKSREKSDFPHSTKLSLSLVMLTEITSISKASGPILTWRRNHLPLNQLSKEVTCLVLLEHARWMNTTINLPAGLIVILLKCNKDHGDKEATIRIILLVSLITLLAPRITLPVYRKLHPCLQLLAGMLQPPAMRNTILQ